MIIHVYPRGLKTRWVLNKMAGLAHYSRGLGQDAGGTGVKSQECGEGNQSTKRKMSGRVNSLLHSQPGPGGPGWRVGELQDGGRLRVRLSL